MAQEPLCRQSQAELLMDRRARAGSSGMDPDALEAELTGRVYATA